MKISELPLKLRELCLKEIKLQGGRVENGSIGSSFKWKDSSQGHKFWGDLFNGLEVPDDECYKPYLNQTYEIY